MTKIEREYQSAKQAEIEAARRQVQAAEAVNSAMRLLLQAEDVARDTAREHAEALQRLVVATRDLTSEQEAIRDEELIALAFPDRNAQA